MVPVLATLIGISFGCYGAKVSNQNIAVVIAMTLFGFFGTFILASVGAVAFLAYGLGGF
jgi:hypothetical protein